MENKIEQELELELDNKIKPEMENKIIEQINNYEIIFFYKSSKENITIQNDYIDYLINNILDSNSNRELITPEYTFLNIDDDLDNNILLNLKKKHKINNQNIELINKKLNKICEHQIIEDYIETGIEMEMIKINYCQICQLTM